MKRFAVLLSAAILVGCDSAPPAPSEPAGGAQQAEPELSNATPNVVAPTEANPSADPQETSESAEEGSAEAIAAITQLGAQVTYNREGKLQGVLIYAKANFGDADLACLDALSALNATGRPELLVVEGKNITDEGLVHLEGLSNLQVLSINDTPMVTDAGLEHLVGMSKLRRLELKNVPVTDAGLKHLAKLRRLRNLNVSGASVTEDGINTLKKSLRGCSMFVNY